MATGPVRPSSLALRPSDAGAERNGHDDASGLPSLQRRPGALKEKPDKWRAGRKSDGGSPPLPDAAQHKRQIHAQYVHTVLCRRAVAAAGCLMLFVWVGRQFCFID